MNADFVSTNSSNPRFRFTLAPGDDEDGGIFYRCVDFSFARVLRVLTLVSVDDLTPSRPSLDSTSTLETLERESDLPSSRLRKLTLRAGSV